jgi:hypothetical protein
MRPDLTEVPALTLLAPWPVAIIADIPDPKRIENRTWAPPESVHQLMVHAGKGHDAAGYDLLEQYGIDLPEQLPPAAVVALADLAYVCDHTVNRWPIRTACGCGRWAVHGQYHWRLGRVWVLPQPVPCRGYQKLWQPAPEVRAAVQAQLDGAVAR